MIPLHVFGFLLFLPWMGLGVSAWRKSQGLAARVMTEAKRTARYCKRKK